MRNGYRIFSTAFALLIFISTVNLYSNGISVPPGPQNLSGFPGDGKAYLKWSPAPADTIWAYYIFQSDTASFDSSFSVGMVSSNDSMFTVEELENWLPMYDYYYDKQDEEMGNYYFWVVSADSDTVMSEPGDYLNVRPMYRSDEFGYTWSSNADQEMDAPEYAWTDITETGEQIDLSGDDNTSGPLDLGFDFPFYNWHFNEFFVCTNGFISFTSLNSTTSSPPFPFLDYIDNYYYYTSNESVEKYQSKFNYYDWSAATLAPFWTDLQFYEDSLAYFWSDGEKAIIQYNNVPPYGEYKEGSETTFQIVLFADGDFQFIFKEAHEFLYNGTAATGWQNHAYNDGLNVMYSTEGVIRDELIIHVENTSGSPIGEGPQVIFSDFADNSNYYYGKEEILEPGLSYGKIMEMSADGNEASIVKNTEIDYPNSVTVDYANEKMFFINGPSFLSPVKAPEERSFGVFRSDLDGSNVDTLFLDPTMEYGLGDLLHDPYNDLVYWSFFNTNYIVKYYLNDGETDTLYILDTLNNMPVAFDIDFGSNTLYWSSTMDGSIYKANLDSMKANLIIAAQYAIDLESDVGNDRILWINIENTPLGTKSKFQSPFSTIPSKTEGGAALRFLDTNTELDETLGYLPYEFLPLKMDNALGMGKIAFAGLMLKEAYYEGPPSPGKSLYSPFDGNILMLDFNLEDLYPVMDGLDFATSVSFNLPAAPGQVLSQASPGFNEIAWTLNSESPYAYNVYRDTIPYPETLLRTVSLGVSKFSVINITDDEIEGGVTYYYRVAEVTSDGFMGNFSAQTSATALHVPKTEISTDEVDFGGVEVDSTESVKLVIYSTGTHDLVVKDIDLINASVFSFSNMPVLPDTLAPGDTLAFNVTFTPNSVSNFADSVKIETNAAYPAEDSLLYVKVIGEGTPVSDISDDAGIPQKFALRGNYPNPFNPSTNIKIDIPSPGNLEIKIYNLLGQIINELYNAPITAGRHSIRWDGKSISGQQVGSGIYFYLVKYNGKQSVRKMTLLK